MKRSTTSSRSGKPPEPTEAERLLARGYKLVRLQHLSKAPVGHNWPNHPVTKVDPRYGYGFLLQQNGRVSLDPDDVKRTRIALAALGFDLDVLMAAGSHVRSTRPGSGGRSMFADPGMVVCLRFAIGPRVGREIIFELRAGVMQDLVPGSQYEDKAGNLCVHSYVGKWKYDDARDMPAKFRKWWQRCSVDAGFWVEQKQIMCKALGVEYHVELRDRQATKPRKGSTNSGVHLPFTCAQSVGFNQTHNVPALLEAHGYISDGRGRYSPPSATGAPGVRLIPGKQDLWQSDHGSDLLNGTFDAWHVYVMLDHEGDPQKAAQTYEHEDINKLQAALQQQPTAPPINGHPAPPIPIALPSRKPLRKEKKTATLPERFTLAELKKLKIPPTQWLVEGLIPPGLTLLAAPPKAGKSYFALQMAMCVAAGKRFLERETTQCSVTYFDLEEEHELLMERVVPICMAHDIPDNIPINFQLTMPTGEDAIAAMAEEIKQGVKLLIVDLFARIRDELNEDAHKNAYARDYKVITMIADFALKHPGVAIVVIHHANKGTHDEWQAKISGSYGLAGGSHANIYMARPDLRGSKSDDEKQEALRYRTVQAVGKRVAEQEFVIEKMQHMGGWQRSELRSGEISITLKRAEVLNFLLTRGAEFTTAREVANAMGLTLKNVQQMLYRMGQKGQIESGGQGGDGYRVRGSRAGARTITKGIE